MPRPFLAVDLIQLQPAPPQPGSSFSLLGKLRHEETPAGHDVRGHCPADGRTDHEGQGNGIDYTYLQLDHVSITQPGNAGIAHGGILSVSCGFHHNFQMFGAFGALNFNKVSDDDLILGRHYWHSEAMR